MKTKNLSLMIASVFAVVLFLAFASASFTVGSLTATSGIPTYQGDTTTITYAFNVTNTNAVSTGINYTTFNPSTMTLPSGFSWKSLQTKEVDAGKTEQFNITLSIQGLYTVDLSSQSVSLNLSGLDTSSTTSYGNNSVVVTFNPDSFLSLASSEFCSLTSSSDNLDLSVDVKNKGIGDDNTWNLLDTIEVKVRMKNNLADDLDDGVLKLKLLNDNGQDVADDLIWISDDSGEYEFGAVDAGKRTDYHTFVFRVNPETFASGSSSVAYKLVIEATAKDGSGDEHCIDYSNDLSDLGSSVYYGSLNIHQSSNEVVVDTANPSLESSTASCEQQVTLTADVWNTGENDYSDQIAVNLYNQELGINETKTISEDLSSGDKTQVTFTFTIPKGMEEKIYELAFTTYYDWDSDHSKYKRNSNDGEYTLPFTLSGNCILPEASVNAFLEGDAISGKQLLIRATVSNIATIDSDYTFALDGYSDWAKDATINNSISLTAGESGDVMVSMDVNRKIEGDQTFNILVYSDGNLILTQPVQVTIAKSSFFGNNGAVIALIALITAIAIAIIIVLIVRASNKKKQNK